MNKLFTGFALLASASLLAACQTASPGSPEAKALAIQKVEEKKVEAVEQTVSDLPSWCQSVPSTDLALYACGAGNSGNMNMARTRATLDAKRQLADMIDSQISSRMEDFLQSIGTGANEQVRQQSEIVTKNVTVEAQLTGYKQKEAETQNIGSKYQHYVLLEYPIGKANQALLNKIKQDEILSTQKAADAAMAELEAEIKNLNCPFINTTVCDSLDSDCTTLTNDGLARNGLPRTQPEGLTVSKFIFIFTTGAVTIITFCSDFKIDIFRNAFISFF